MKRVSPNSVALLISLIGTSVFALFVFFFSSEEMSSPIQLGWVFGFFAVLYFTTFLFIKWFISDKLRRIYSYMKNISPKRLKRVGVRMNDPVINSAEKEAEEWAKNKKTEIAQLKEQEKFRREFIGNLAHELKTPLFNIQGYVLTLLEGGLEDKKVNRLFLEKAAKGVERLSDLVEDLDDITKMESIGISLDLKSFSLLELAEDTIDDLKVNADEKDISLELAKPYENPFMVMADRSKIQQVITNLVVNAINYGKEKGMVKLSIFRNGDKVTLEVEDDGIGIKESELARISERFYRVEKSRSNHVKGTGLGLAIVKHILEAHEEIIMISSEYGKGSLFSFSLRKAN